MKAYWIRMLGAWLLVKLASGLVKDAEQLLKQSADSTALAVEEPTVIEGTVTDG